MGNVCLGRMYHYRIRPIIGKPVIEAFQKENIRGFKYIPLEDHENAFGRALANGDRALWESFLAVSTD